MKLVDIYCIYIVDQRNCESNSKDFSKTENKFKKWIYNLFFMEIVEFINW